MPLGSNIPLGTMFCHFCNGSLTEETQSYSVETVCQDCYDTEMAHCVSCDTRGWINYDASLIRRAITANRNMAYGQEPVPTELMYYLDTEGDWFCQDCTTCCGDCGTRYAYDSDAMDCCERYRQAIRNYSYKPNVSFFEGPGSGNYISGISATWATRPTPMTLYMGVEIEVERASGYAEEFLELANENSSEDPFFVYLKYDGSLSEDGMEIVTMPATLDAFREMFPFKSTDMLRDNGARAWAYTSCGMHVHVSRSAFTASHLWKFIKWQTENWEQCVQFAGRMSQQWASWNNETMDVCRTNTSKAVKGRGYADWNNRYSAINIIPHQTVELRYFRPNLNKDGILRVIEFIQAIYDYTKQMSYSDVFNRRYNFELFKSFMEEKDKYQYALNYINVNEI